jgi:hypothetical protein
MCEISHLESTQHLLFEEHRKFTQLNLYTAKTNFCSQWNYEAIAPLKRV